MQHLTYQDILSCSRTMSDTDLYGFNHRVYENKHWGQIEERNLFADHFAIFEYKTALHTGLRVRFNEEQMLHSMNVCLALNGSIAVDFKESQKKAGLSSLRHHSLYAHEKEYDVIFGNDLNGVHLAIDLDYYLDLLCDQEAWSASLKEKLLRREFVLQGDAGISPEMLQAIRDLMFNPLEGKLKRLLMEAKILELVALQLSQYSTVKHDTALRQKDVDTFYDLKNYLDTNFSDDLSLKSLSRMFGLNEFKLKKGFKTLFDSTVFDYIHAQRMKYAHQLLADHKMQVNEVSRKVGYKNANHFSTAFKRKFGINPVSLR